MQVFGMLVTEYLLLASASLKIKKIHYRFRKIRNLWLESSLWKNRLHFYQQKRKKHNIDI